jgi:hypothetical protein
MPSYDLETLRQSFHDAGIPSIYFDDRFSTMGDRFCQALVPLVERPDGYSRFLRSGGNIIVYGEEIGRTRVLYTFSKLAIVSRQFVRALSWMDIVDLAGEDLFMDIDVYAIDGLPNQEMVDKSSVYKFTQSLRDLTRADRSIFLSDASAENLRSLLGEGIFYEISQKALQIKIEENEILISGDFAMKYLSAEPVVTIK